MLNWDSWFDDEHSKSTINDNLLPFHKDEERNFWKSDDVRDWRQLGYDYPILKGRKSNNEQDRKNILKEIESLYGHSTKQLYNGLPAHHGGDDDFIITVVYDR